jgi:predicted phosphodiesterase
MSAKSLKSTKAKEIALRYPNTGNAPLADLLFKENPVLYKDKEDARQFIRAVRGSKGKRERKFAKEVKHFPNGKHNPYDLPDQEHNNFEPLIIQTDESIKIGVLSDIHFPFQDNLALSTALDEFKRLKVDVILLNGDVIDCYAESDFLRDPTKRRFKEELAILKNFLSILRKEFPSARIIYKEGNHEMRHKAYMLRKAPEMYGLEETKFENLAGLESFGVEWVDNKRIIEIGKLTVVHGHEFPRGFGSPVSPAKTFYTRAKKSVLGGHHHQVTSYSAKAINGKQHVAYSTGCLCDLTPEYMPLNEWSHGFAIIELFPDGTFDVQNKKLVLGKITNS